MLKFEWRDHLEKDNESGSKSPLVCSIDLQIESAWLGRSFSRKVIPGIQRFDHRGASRMFSFTLHALWPAP